MTTFFRAAPLVLSGVLGGVLGSMLGSALVVSAAADADAPRCEGLR
jgi:hypothetical protein